MPAFPFPFTVSKPVLIKPSFHSPSVTSRPSSILPVAYPINMHFRSVFLSRETMANIFSSTGAECLLAKHLPLRICNGNDIIRCNSQSPSQFRLKRRQMLLASTSVRVPSPGLTLNPNDRVSILTDYRKLHDAQKLKFKHVSDIDVASLFRSSDPAEPSGTVSVPSQHYCLGNYDFVQARVSRPSFSEEYRGREEEVILQGIKVKRDRPLWFDAYIRPGGREEDDEYAGSFIHRPPRQKQSGSLGQKQPKSVGSCCLKLGISDIMDDFDAHQETNVVVTLVPRFNRDEDPISVENICIEYSS